MPGRTVQPRVSASLPEPLMRWLEKMAREWGVSKSQAVVRVLEKMREGGK